MRSEIIQFFLYSLIFLKRTTLSVDRARLGTWLNFSASDHFLVSGLTFNLVKSFEDKSGTTGWSRIPHTRRHSWKKCIFYNFKLIWNNFNKANEIWENFNWARRSQHYRDSKPRPKGWSQHVFLDIYVK